MKPLKTELQDAETLRDLGSASVQIVHDLKNQLNGLKLYATFLRKRMEKAERPADEQETLAKLISGLERAASDMNVLVRFGRALELRRQPGTDLARLLQDSAEGARVCARPRFRPRRRVRGRSSPPEPCAGPPRRPDSGKGLRPLRRPRRPATRPRRPSRRRSA